MLICVKGMLLVVAKPSLLRGILWNFQCHDRNGPPTLSTSHGDQPISVSTTNQNVCVLGATFIGEHLLRVDHTGVRAQPPLELGARGSILSLSGIGSDAFVI